MTIRTKTSANESSSAILGKRSTHSETEQTHHQKRKNTKTVKTFICTSHIFQEKDTVACSLVDQLSLLVDKTE